MRFALGLLLFAALGLAGIPARAWDDFQIIEWQHRDAAQLATLKQLGVTAATVVANRDGTGTPVEQQIAPMLANGLRWYVENIATDYYSAYHRWLPPHPVNWRFLDAQQRYRANPDDESALWRDPSLADPMWQRRIRDRLIATVRGQMRYRPLYYSLGDETGIADLSAFWDFDLSPGSLAGMRVWLRQTYGSLAALNAEWGTRFADWNDVHPATTREAMRRTDDNYSSWADFKAWMDVAFARALRMGTDAVHHAEPTALAAIEGVQVPGWGGYDYTLLVNAVDVLEVDDLPLAHSLNPHVTTLTTSFDAQPRGLHKLWRNLLAGSRGVILWDSDGTIVRPDAALGERGQAYAETFREIRGGIGHLLLNSEPHSDPIAILYSPASFRVQWMLEQKPKGDAWMNRDAEAELSGDAAREAMWAYASAVTHQGLQPMFVSPAMIEHGALRQRGIKLLILPHAIALSRAEAQQIRDFRGAVIADVQPGKFDEHGRRLDHPLLDAGTSRMVAPDQFRNAASEGCQPPLPVIASVAKQSRPDCFAALAAISPSIHVDAADVTVHIWRDGKAQIVGVQRDFAPDAPDEQVTLNWPGQRTILDLRTNRTLGRSDHLTARLDAVYPLLLSLTP